MPVGINMLGLTDQIVSCIYPLSLDGLGLALAIFNPGQEEKITLLFRNQNTLDEFEITIQMTVASESTVDSMTLRLGWIKAFGRAPKNSVIKTPGLFGAFLKDQSGTEEFLGYLSFHHFNPPPLNSATIEALKADPMARKYVRFRLACNTCGEQFKCYSGVERSPNSEGEGWIWQSDLPDMFICQCKATSQSLIYLKNGLHWMLGRSQSSPSGLMTVVTLYERSALEQYCLEFRKLLDSNPEKEQILQEFLDEHKIFLHRFAAVQILTKPPILSKFNADFAILNNRKELLLIEIERSTIKLLKSYKNSFGITADLQHAIDQVRSWKQMFDDYRDAALAMLGIEKIEVAKIKGIVIAGRTPEDKAAERYLRALSLDIELFTYDDLIADVGESVRHIAAV